MQRVHDRPGNVGVPGGVGAGCAVGHLAAAGGTTFDREEGLGDIGPTRVPFDAAALDRVLGLEYQEVFRLKAVVDRGRPGVEVAHQVEHAVANAGGVDTDVLHVEALGELLDLVGLVLEGLAPPAVLLQDPELGPGLQRWRDDHTSGVVACAAWVVADPDRAVSIGAVRFGVEVVPQRQIGIAALQVFEAECALGAVDELAVEQLLELVLVVLQLQLLDVEKIAAPGDRIVQGDGLAPLAIRTERALRVGRFAGPGAAGFLSALAVAELFAGPEGVGLVRYRAGRREVGFSPLLVGAHGAGHGAEFVEVANPEIFIDVDMPVVALGGAAVGAEKAQLRAIAEHNGVAGQLDAEPLLGKLDDVAAEDLRLRSAGRQEHLVVAAEHGVHESLAGKVVGQAHLAAFEDVADSPRQRVLLGLEQLLLIAVHLGDELIQEVHLGEAADVVLGLFLPLLAATLPTAGTVATRSLAGFLGLALIVAGRNRRRWFRSLFQQPLANSGQPVQFVQIVFGQAADLIQQQGNSPAYSRQRFFIRKHVLPPALAYPVVDDPDIGQVELRLNFLRLAAA